MTPASIFGVLVASSGVAIVASAVRRPALDVRSILAELEGAPPADGFAQRLNEPLLTRLFGAALARPMEILRSLLPANYLETARRKLTIAGIEHIGPEAFVAMQCAGAAIGVTLALAIAALLGWGTIGTLRAMPVLAGLGAFAPIEWRQRQRAERSTSMRRDLPDVLDLLAISVEAGVGLEGAIQVVGDHFDSPLAYELQRMLREMELGVSRRRALKSMRARIELPEVGQFILALIQADALGMPLGKVLRVQAGQMRAKRRQWARERAAKLPVKIIFPLLGFILPALFVVVLGPAVSSIAKNVLHR